EATEAAPTAPQIVARPAESLTVLPVAVNVVRNLVIHADAIHLRDRQHHAPVAHAFVVADGSAGVVCHQDTIRIDGVKPHIVIVASGGGGQRIHQRLTAVTGNAEGNRNEKDQVLIVGSDGETSVVGRALIQDVRLIYELPGSAAVVGAIKA